jgi:hypothetical protein
MVLLIIIPIKWLFHWEYTLFSDKPILAIRYLLAMAMWQLAQDTSQNSPIDEDHLVKALHDWRLALPQNLGMSTTFHHPKNNNG